MATEHQEQAFLRDEAQEAERNLHDLWRWALTQKKGREFLYEVILDLGYLRPLHLEPTDRMYRDLALHNLCVHWMRTFVLPHRDLYLQMMSEATKREDEARERLEARRQEWARERTES